MWEMFRPFVWSFVRHGVLTGAAYLTAKTGIPVDDSTVNGVANVLMSGADLGAMAVISTAGGIAGSAFSNVQWRALFQRG